MVIEIKKGTSKKEIEEVLKNTSKKKHTPVSLDSFFGKLPDIEDGLNFQKKVRREWK